MLIQKVWQAVRLAFNNKIKTNSNSKHVIAKGRK